MIEIGNSLYKVYVTDGYVTFLNVDAYGHSYNFTLKDIWRYTVLHRNMPTYQFADTQQESRIWNYLRSV